MVESALEIKAYRGENNVTTLLPSIEKYSGLIKLIPVNNQSTRIKREAWKRFSDNDKAGIVKSIFGSKDVVELSRADVFFESDTAKRIVMVLMWGYPTGGRGNNIKNILTEIDMLGKLMSGKKDLTTNEANDLIKQFKGIHGLGVSTWTKLLYFFNFSVDSRRCQIFDQKIVDSLNKKQFSELDTQKWKQDTNHYYRFIDLVDKLASRMCVTPEQVELFLFYYNLDYKFPFCGVNAN